MGHVVFALALGEVHPGIWRSAAKARTALVNASVTGASAAVEATWTVPASVDTRLSCPIRRESKKWVRHAAHIRRSTRSNR